MKIMVSGMNVWFVIFNNENSKKDHKPNINFSPKEIITNIQISHFIDFSGLLLFTCNQVRNIYVFDA